MPARLSNWVLQRHHPVRSQALRRLADDGDRVWQELKNQASHDRIEWLSIPWGRDAGTMAAHIGKPRGRRSRAWRIKGG